ncbi:IS21 family transposase [Actinomadura rupiterrae]|uniref:IS21 family transposase n=1 Tax=Actinomadura rupiterrae TaxID=559627 RepID=UPI0020A2A4CF|nr:IS21 family transposase [Actinomadura rupiterrae]MCP2337357.1 transposase [Actinomadura rupiterrae]
MKSDAEITEILAAYDLTRSVWAASELVGCHWRTVKRYVGQRESGALPTARERQCRVIDPFLEKIEEKVEASRGKIRADILHGTLAAMGFEGSERTTRRAVAEAKKAFWAGRRRVYRPWVAEPGLWLQFDWGEGPRIGGRRTKLFCAWLAWSRFRVVVPSWDETSGSLITCLDTVLRRIGAAPMYLLTDNAKTVTVKHIAGVPVRHPIMVEAGRHYGCKIETCEPYDPESKGGAECTVKIAKADLVPTDTNLQEAYGSFADLERACLAWNSAVNGRKHRETQQIPAVMLAEELALMHAVAAEPFAAALGEERLVGDDRTIRWKHVKYSVPPGFEDTAVWAREHGEQLIVTAQTEHGLAEIWRHELSRPGHPVILDEHYPDHPGGGNDPRPVHIRPRTDAEEAFCGLGEGAKRWLVEAAASGAARIQAKMARAVELADAVGADVVEEALGMAAIWGRFAEGDLPALCDHVARTRQGDQGVWVDEEYSAQPGTSGWAALPGIVSTSK